MQLLDHVPALASGDDEMRRMAEVAMVAFMATAAWGYNPVSDARYGSRLGRFAYLSDLNRDIYRVTRLRSRVVVQVHRRSGMRTLELGRTVGFSAVIPLTDAGFRNYCLNGKAMTELGEGDVVRTPYRPNSIRYLLVTGLVDIRALPSYLGGIREFPRVAHAVLAGLGRQIGGFIPEIDWWVESGMVHAQATTGRHLPIILCPLSGRGMGEDLLETAGFNPEGEDARRNRVWTLDLEEMNGRPVGDPYFHKLFKANRYIDKCRL